MASPLSHTPLAPATPPSGALPMPAGTATRVGRNAAFRLASQVLSAILNVAGMVILGNHLSAAGYGEYVFYYAFLPLFASAADLGAGVIITREIARDPQDGARRMGDGLLLKGVLGVALLAVTAGLAWRVMAPAHAFLLLIVAAGALLDFSQDAAVWVFRAHERLEFEALLLLVSQVAWLAGIGLAVWLGASLPFLLATALAAFLLRTLMGLWLVSRTLYRPRFAPDWSRLLDLVRESWPLGLSMLLVVLYGRTGVLALKAWSGAADVACFNVAYLLSQPLGFVSSALSMAAFPALARFAQTNPNVLRPALQHTLKVQMLATLPLTVGLWLLAPSLIPLLFRGADFAAAAASLRIVALGLPFIFLNLQSRYVLAALDRQRTYLWAVVVGLAVNVACCAASVPALGATGAAWSFVAAEAVIFVVCQTAASVHLSASDLLRASARPAVAATLMGVSVFATRALGLPLAVVAGAVTYVVALVLTRAVTRAELELLWQVCMSLRPPGTRPLAREADLS
jgi:O-antigen/teichoic acid export membrane protein